VEQLDARLPTQTHTVQVPVVNTLGGFEMFNSGTTDLAPDLYGFYGAPGVRPDDISTLFLVGDHFSPLRTKVIVGNQECKVEMLSRQVVKVIVPPYILDTNENYVHAHLATPYGVTREIRIPLTRALADPKAQLFLTDSAWSMNFKVIDKKNSTGVVTYSYELPPETSAVQPATVSLVWTASPPENAPDSVKIKIEFTVGDGATGQFVWEREVPRVGNTFAIPIREMVEQLVAKKLNTAEFQPKEPGALAKAPWSGPHMPTSFKVLTKDGTKEYSVKYSQPIILSAIQTPSQTTIPTPPPPK
jgi:hypothetical protein